MRPDIRNITGLLAFILPFSVFAAPPDILPGSPQDPNPKGFLSPREIRYFAPDADLMEGHGQFLFVDEKYMALAELAPVAVWSSEPAFCLTVFARSPINQISLHLNLPHARPLELEGKGESWIIYEDEVWQRAENSWDHRWTANRKIPQRPDAATGRYENRLCVTGLDASMGNAREHFESLAFHVNNPTEPRIAYIPDPDVSKYRTPSENIRAQVISDMQPAGLDEWKAGRWKVSGAQLAGSASRLRADGSLPKKNDARRYRVGTGEVKLDIREIHSGEQRQVCIHPSVTGSYALEHLEIGVGTVTIPHEAGLEMWTATEIPYWHITPAVHAAEGRQTLVFQFRSSIPAKNRRNIGEACFEIPHELAERLPDWKQLEYEIITSFPLSRVGQ